MKNRYEEAMHHVRLSEETRSRILRTVAQADLTPPKQPLKFPSTGRWLSLAACLALILMGSLALPRLGRPELPPVSSTGIVELDSARELSESTGFPVEDLPDLPFRVKKAVYRAHRQKLAEITYEGEGETATFRMSAGVEDNSGDHSTYGKVKNLEWGGLDATLKGSADLYTLATWTDGTYACSLHLSRGLSEEQWKNLISGTCN